jgi:hypothetical protein
MHYTSDLLQPGPAARLCAQVFLERRLSCLVVLGLLLGVGSRTQAAVILQTGFGRMDAVVGVGGYPNEPDAAVIFSNSERTQSLGAVNLNASAGLGSNTGNVTYSPGFSFDYSMSSGGSIFSRYFRVESVQEIRFTVTDQIEQLSIRDSNWLPPASLAFAKQSYTSVVIGLSSTPFTIRWGTTWRSFQFGENSLENQGIVGLEPGEYSLGFSSRFESVFDISGAKASGFWEFLTPPVEAPGYSPASAISPTGENPTVFDNVATGKWVEVASAPEVLLQMDGDALFSGIGGVANLPPGEYQLLVDGQTFLLTETSYLDFTSLLGHGVSSFILRQLGGSFPAASRLAASAPTLQLLFNSSSATFSMTPVPEAGPMTLVLFALCGIVAGYWRRVYR